MSDRLFAALITGGVLFALCAWIPALEYGVLCLRRRGYRRQIEAELPELMGKVWARPADAGARRSEVLS